MGTVNGLGDVNWRRRVIAVIVFTLSLPIVLPALFVAYISWVPPYSARMAISDLHAEMTLRFYYVSDVSTETGRYLTISAPGGRKTIAMTAFDWAHNSRTSIYRTPDGEIAILGPIGDDYLVSPDTMKVVQRYAADSERWIYLGAFDYERFQHGRELRFFRTDEQPECIPMVGLDIHATQARYAARKRDCNIYVRPGKK
jgi:hypothetical protein